MPESHPETPIYAVLTGDLVASSDMTAARLEQVRNTLKTAAEIFSNSFPRPVEIRLDMYRGDAWQVLLNDSGLALRLSLYLRARLRAGLEADTRVSIGLGLCDTIDPAKVSLSTGEAFTLSGRALDHMTGYFDMTAAVPERAGALCQWLPASLHLVSEIVRAWTRRQAEIASEALLRPEATHEDIAQLLDPPVSKQSVTASLSGAGWRALQEPLKAFEDTDWRALLAPAHRETRNR
ncbi:hypothetical protein [Henriciella aquimarina]|uniref:hypothetical protein n=1 Tax=Henriciella aquimarina TaxID=545261 RepID=UPI0009FCEF08|nr:hypothetical protein [Henriciella aquimarina]